MPRELPDRKLLDKAIQFLRKNGQDKTGDLVAALYDSAAANLEEAYAAAKETEAIRRSLQAAQATINDLTMKLAEHPTRGSASDHPERQTRSVTGLIGEIRTQFEQAAASARRTPSGGAPAMVIENAEFEIRGILDIGEQVGLKAPPLGQSGPECASTIRFSLRPETSIEVVSKPRDQAPTDANKPTEPTAPPKGPEKR